MDKINLQYNKYVAGKPFGERLRKELELDKVDFDGKIYEVIIPEGFSSNGSFIEGVFVPSVGNCGSRAEFVNKYQFPEEMSEDFSIKLEEMIIYALRLKNRENHG